MKLAGRLAVVACLGVMLLAALGQEPPRTGPATEKRFPALKLPTGFRATLFACDPLIEYPSVIALGPRPGTLFVAVDYLTGLGTQIVRRDEIRLVEDTDGDGYADKATVWADGFNSIQGLAYHDDTVYVMHAPFLTALRDKNGGGKADDRRDLVNGLGLPPEKNPVRLHCANGVVPAHDGWLYLALGDYGCDVPRPEGDRLVLPGGGILRCRPDGRDLHVFATGLRNIYDVALDDELNVFVRDNENDGGDYKIRVCHSFFGADHGYPYLYYERPEEALPPLADLGLGSSAGGVCYLERQFPPDYRGNLFFCEWGRAVMRYRPERADGGFAPLKEHLFAAGADNDPYGFKPTDLVVERDGSLMVADWADGQQPKRGRGRIYRIRATDAASGTSDAASGGRKPPEDSKDLNRWLPQLDSESGFERIEAQRAIERQGREGIKALEEALDKGRVDVRGRLHAVWIIAHAHGAAAQDRLYHLAKTDPDPRVQAQAVRALADLLDPVLSSHRLDAGAADEEAARLAALAPGKDPRVLLEVVIAVGRLRWRETPAWLAKTLTKPDPALAHAAMQALRRSGNWQALLQLLDRPAIEPIRAIALRAIGDQAVPEIVDGLSERLVAERDPSRKREYADALARVYKKPGPWVYWGFRPPPRPPNTLAWDRTEAIEQALNRVLADDDRSVRLAVLRRMLREKVPTALPTLGRWLKEEKESDTIGTIVDALRAHPAGSTRELLESVIAAGTTPVAGRRAALALFVAGLDVASATRLLTVANSLEDGPVLAEALRHIGKRPKLNAGSLLLDKLTSPAADVRAAALEALAALHPASGPASGGRKPPEHVMRKLLADKDADVRRAAAAAAGKLNIEIAREPLLTLARDADPGVRRASLESLRLLKEPRAVPLAVASLSDAETQVAALRCLADLGGPDQAKAVAEVPRQNPSAEVLLPTLQMLKGWSRRPDARGRELELAMADLQGVSGILGCWQVAGPLPAADATRWAERWAGVPTGSEEPGRDSPSWQTVFGTGADCRIQFGAGKKPAADAAWLAYTDLHVAESTAIQFLAGSSAALRVSLNGRLVAARDQLRAFQPDAERFDAVLAKGLNRVLLQASGSKGDIAFHLRFRRKSSSAAIEKLAQAALSRAGNADRGRTVFFHEKSECLKCHRWGDHGERIGPDLTGIGHRFARIHLIESILEPNRTIAPSYQTMIVAMKDGRVLTGMKTAETDGLVTLADNQGKKHTLARTDIDDQRPSAQSIMPEGLHNQLTTEEFVDLIAFLAAQKKDP